jgi:hypothetical protein
MSFEREPQKEPVDIFCLYCGEGSKASWKIVSKDGDQEYVCNNHRLFLKSIGEVKSDEEIRWEAQWRMENEYDEKPDDFFGLDDYEDIDNWL